VEARASSWRTHLYIVAIAVAALAPSLGQAPREILNSERIAAVFGNYGIEVLEQDDAVRVSNLYSEAGGELTCRTFAVVRYGRLDAELRAEHAAIVAGGSIGAILAAAGWEVRKTHLRYDMVGATPGLASLMQVAAGTPLAAHVYALDVAKAGRTLEYAALVEIHHPDYLGSDDLLEIYGPADDAARPGLVAAMLATAEAAAAKPR
jgi:hypothetical protein